MSFPPRNRIETLEATTAGISAAELGFIDAVTAGTAAASKAVVLDASKGISTITSATITTLASTTGNITTVNAGADASAGTVNVYPTTTASGTLVLSATDSSTDSAVTITNADHGQATTVTIPDSGLATSYLAQSTAAITVAEMDVLDAVTPGTALASKVLVLDASGNLALPASGNISKAPALLTATVAITAAANANRVNYITGTALATYTLPEATGTGNRYLFVIGEVNTSNNVFVVADTTNANFIGNILTQDADLVGTIATLTQLAPANADTLTFNGTTTGGQKGDWIELIDVATDVWFVTGITSVPAGSNTVTPFSAAV